MASNNKHTGPNVPALRFPEFSGEWESCTLGDITNNFSRRNKDRIQYPMFSVTNNRGFVPQSEQFEDREMVGEDIQAYKVIEKGDFAYNPARINVGSIAKYEGNGKCMISSLYVCFNTIDRIDRDWFMHLLKTPKMNFYYNLNGEGGVRVYLFYPNFARIRSSYPSLAEQKKIAAMLSLIDERIATQSKIIEELKTLRGALNESLYCCCESYQELSFNDVGVSYSGLSGKSGNDFGYGYPFIPYTNIFTNNIIDEGQLEYVQVREDESQNSVCFGDLLMTLSSETPEEVGIGAVYLGHESPLYLNSFAFGIHITRTDLVYPPYLSWLVSTKSFRKFILPYAQGSTRYNLQKTDFMKAKYRFPTLGQQKAISVLLSGYSSKIENEERVLNKYTALKQGLIEQLFI